MKPVAPSPRGFTVAELAVVVCVSLVVAIGLSALIHTPNELMAFQEASRRGGLEAMDRVVRQLDEDVRFSRDVHCPGPSELSVVRGDGALVRYRWAGPDAPLVREAPDGTVSLLKGAARVRFSLATTDAPGTYAEGALAAAEVEVGGFDPLGLVGALLGRQPIDGTRAAGFFFRARDLGAERALVSSVTVRLRKAGACGLRARLFAADPATQQPVKGSLLATGTVPASALPSSLVAFRIPLTASVAVADGDPLFLELSSDGIGAAAEVEHLVLSLLGGLLPAQNGGFLVSEGGAFLPLAAVLAASQATFAVTAHVTRVTAGGAPAGTARVATSVLASFHLDAADEPVEFDVSFPIANNLALVNR